MSNYDRDINKIKPDKQRNSVEGKGATNAICTLRTTVHRNLEIQKRYICASLTTPKHKTCTDKKTAAMRVDGEINSLKKK